MKIFASVLFLNICFLSNLRAQKASNTTNVFTLDSIEQVTLTCIEQHILFLRELNYQSIDTVYVYHNSLTCNLPKNIAGSVVLQIRDYESILPLTAHKKSISVFYVAPEFSGNEFRFIVSLLSTSRKKHKILQINNGSSHFRVNYNCEKRSYEVKVEKQG